MGRRGRAGRVIDFHGDQRLAGDIGNGRLEVFRDGLSSAITGQDRAGNRDGEDSARGGNNGSELHAFSPAAHEPVFSLHAAVTSSPRCTAGRARPRRSEERRDGKEGVSTGRSGWSP